jgi:peroxiredoxin (alkyl hydroperoxide reductase subunit C)
VALQAGTPAPEFRLVKGDFEEFTRASLAAQGTVLVFYPFAFSPVCTDQLQIYEPLLGELRANGIELYAVSCDAPQSQAAFAEKLGVSSVQLSDFEPKGAASRAFDVYHPGGFCQRALVMIDSDGVIRWSYEAPSPGDLPGLELLREGLVEAFGLAPAA